MEPSLEGNGPSKEDREFVAKETGAEEETATPTDRVSRTINTEIGFAVQNFTQLEEAVGNASIPIISDEYNALVDSFHQAREAHRAYVKALEAMRQAGTAQPSSEAIAARDTYERTKGTIVRLLTKK